MNLLRSLRRESENSLKVGVLFFISGLFVLGLDWLGFEELSSPWLGLALLPLALIYCAERLGKLTWFIGMTFPCLLLMAASIGLLWVFNAPVPAMLEYVVLALWLVAAVFLGIRMWTYESKTVASPKRVIE
jgi:hypothetical protein